MHKQVREQLNKCHIAKIPIVEDTFSGDLYIQRADSNSHYLELNNSYLIKLSDSYLDSDQYNSITQSWNHGRELQNRYLKIMVNQFYSNMIKVDARGYDEWIKADTDTIYMEYWLPISCVEILDQL